MKAEQYRQMNDQELEERIRELRQGLFNLRVRNTTKELTDVSRIRAERRELARALTSRSERRLARKAESAAVETGR